jgi:hypothetical protein
VLQDASVDGVTDIFVFSHGWNNDWRAATGRYNNFIDGFVRTHAESHGLSLGRDYQPLLVGLFWPSVILVLPWEQAPVIAAAPGEDPEVDELGRALPNGHEARVRELLARSEALDADEARELAGLVMPLYTSAGEEVPEELPPPAEKELVAAWRGAAAATPARGPGSFGTVDGGRVGVPEAAGFSLDPRKLARLLTVRAMKDRAGVVGVRGVGPLVKDLLEVSGSRVHMVGHSYGCKVCLSAICAAPVPRKVDSLLLLQPAVNHRCFAVDADGEGHPGGYRAALDRVEQPVLSTYSAHDQALTQWFHRALTRRGDLLEVAIAAWPEPPSAYAALGGYGPRGAEQETRKLDLMDPGARYPRDDARVLAVDGTRGIPGHGDISNPYTWWALYDQVAEP